MPFERVLAMTTFLVQVSRIMHRLGRQDLPSLGDRLCAGSSIHDRSDRREVSMGPAELSEAKFAGVEADANPSFVPLRPTPGSSSCLALHLVWMSRAARTARRAWSACLIGKLNTAITASPMVLFRRPSYSQMAQHIRRRRCPKDRPFGRAAATEISWCNRASRRTAPWHRL
jgi:predicted component of type VI protein secretion system